MTERMVLSVEEERSFALTRGYALGLGEAVEYLNSIGDEDGAALFRNRARGLREAADIREARARLRALRASGVTEVPG
jgi:hypothetical protein